MVWNERSANGETANVSYRPKKSVDMSKYSSWSGSNDIQLKIEGMYRIVKGA